MLRFILVMDSEDCLLGISFGADVLPFAGALDALFRSEFAQFIITFLAERLLEVAPLRPEVLFHYIEVLPASAGSIALTRRTDLFESADDGAHSPKCPTQVRLAHDQVCCPAAVDFPRGVCRRLRRGRIALLRPEVGAQ